MEMEEVDKGSGEAWGLAGSPDYA